MGPDTWTWFTDLFSVVTMWRKSVFRSSDCCLRMSFVPAWIMTLEISGLLASTWMVLSVMSWTVAPGKQCVIVAPHVTCLIIESPITRVVGWCWGSPEGLVFVSLGFDSYTAVPSSWRLTGGGSTRDRRWLYRWLSWTDRRLWVVRKQMFFSQNIELTVFLSQMVPAGGGDPDGGFLPCLFPWMTVQMSRGASKEHLRTLGLAPSLGQSLSSGLMVSSMAPVQRKSWDRARDVWCCLQGSGKPQPQTREPIISSASWIW